MPVSLIDLPVEKIPGLGAQGVRPGTYDAHSAQDHIDQLRQLIQAATAQEPSDARYPGVVPPLCQLIAVSICAIHPHAAEFMHEKSLVSAADPFLSEEDWAFAIDLDGGGDQQEHWQQGQQRYGSN
jgi:hypothetical protein